jgi:hypothetical protein
LRIERGQAGLGPFRLKTYSVSGIAWVLVNRPTRTRRYTVSILALSLLVRQICGAIPEEGS